MYLGHILVRDNFDKVWRNFTYFHTNVELKENDNLLYFGVIIDLKQLHEASTFVFVFGENQNINKLLKLIQFLKFIKLIKARH